MHAKEIGSSLFMLAVAIAFWLGADAIPSSALEGSVGAAGFPKLLAVSLGVLALARMAQVVLAARRAGESLFPAAGGAGRQALSDGTTNWHEHKRAAGMLVIGILYVVILPVLGYAASIALLVAAVALYAGARPSAGMAAVVIGGTAILYGLFVWLLDVPMPAGIWGALMSR